MALGIPWKEEKSLRYISKSILSCQKAHAMRSLKELTTLGIEAAKTQLLAKQNVFHGIMRKSKNIKNIIVKKNTALEVKATITVEILFLHPAVASCKGKQIGAIMMTWLTPIMG